ncbi:MAG: type II toxin-antitoxin system RelE/ParE family toxin [Treponema sp.]|jgi:putative addiction module killer protein|nr:type II toxin-antitoxin system RelE/ParE family toxin [Treponema sp.]
MKRVRKTNVYRKWIKRLKDKTGKAIILQRIKRLYDGNPGDCAPVGEGVSEMRIHTGPGYWVYFRDTGTELILLLCGGDKSTQQTDITQAKELALIPLEEEKVWKK